jgi:hypothetical protein
LSQLALGAGTKPCSGAHERRNSDRSERSLPGREFLYLEAVSVRFLVVTLSVFIVSR